MTLTLPPLIFWLSCIAALGLGWIIRHVLEEAGVDVEEKIRRLFGRR